jgi:hypothetical protein
MRKIVYFLIASLIFVSMSVYYGLGQIPLRRPAKFLDDLEIIVNEFNSNETLLVWLDVRIHLLPDGVVYLSERDITPVTVLGVKIAGVTYSPDKQSLWYLVEAHADVIPRLVDLPMVQNVSIVKASIWEYWDVAWWKTTKIDPLLLMMADRVGNDTLQVFIYYGEQNGSRLEIESKIITLVKSVDGEILQVGLAEYILAEVPVCSLDQIAKNSYVKILEAAKPLYCRGYSSMKFVSYNQWSLLVLLPLVFVTCWLHGKNPVKAKSTWLILLIVVTSLASYHIATANALNISRFAIGANRAENEGDEVVVAVIDTGIDYNHPYLSDAIVHNEDIAGYNDTMDIDGYGTHVAGIVASRSARYRGVAPRSKIINVKTRSPYEIVSAIQWCIDNKNEYNISVIQISVGTEERPCAGDCLWCVRADRAVDAGMVVVVAANDIDTDDDGLYELGCPEQAEKVISVGAINDLGTAYIGDDTMAYYSAYGQTLDDREKPEVVAPGGQTDSPPIGIWSTRSSQAPAENYQAVDGVYGRMMGTSMAAPHVSGVAALILYAHPDWGPPDVKKAIMETAMLNDNLQESEGRGKGIVDAERSVKWDLNSTVGLGNPSFEQRLESVWTIPYWCTNISNYQNNWRELRGDINGDGWCEMMDSWLMGQAYGSYPGHPKWDPRCDLNGDNYVEMMDYLILYQDYGKQTKSHDDNYSWYINGEGEYAM